MKRKAPQFELPGAGETFNLVVERSVDGERVQREEAAAARLAREAKEIERRCQPELISDQLECLGSGDPGNPVKAGQVCPPGPVCPDGQRLVLGDRDDRSLNQG